MQVEGTRTREGDFRAGSFPSLEAANKLVTAALAANRETVLSVTIGERPAATLRMYVNSPTGIEAYALTPYSKATIRETDGVFVLIIHDRKMPFQFCIHTAFPVMRGKND